MSVASERARRIREIESLRRQHQDFKDTPQHEMVLIRELYNAIDHDFEDRIRALDEKLASLEEDDERRDLIEEELASLRREHESFRDMPQQERMHELYNEILLDQEDQIRRLEKNVSSTLFGKSRRGKGRKMTTLAAFFDKYRKKHPNVPAREIFDKYHKARQLFMQ